MSGSLPILPIQAVRLLALKSQGLTDPAFTNKKNGALEVIQQLGYVQIDTLAVVSRAHHHVMSYIQDCLIIRKIICRS
jgi:uncharacterized protein